jgi:Zn-dependent protease with chaperone function
MAALIQLGTLILAAIGVGIWVTGLATFAKVIISLLAFLLVAAVVPVAGRRGELLGQPTAWSRAEAPNVFALLSAVSTVAGSPVPARVAVSDEFNASTSRARKKTTLTLGLPLWESLDDTAKVSLLGHELGDTVNGDIRNSWLIRESSISCRKWLRLLSPDEIPGEEHMQQQKMRFARGARAGAGGRLGDKILRIVLIPVYAVAVAVGYAYFAVVRRCSQRAEYRSDLIALHAGGSTGMAELLDAYATSDTAVFQLSTAARRGDSDLFASMRTAMATLPDDERERLRRRSRARLERADADHPLTVMRAEYTAAAGEKPPSPIDGSLIAAATEELRRATPEVDRRLRNRAGDTT